MSGIFLVCKAYNREILIYFYSLPIHYSILATDWEWQSITCCNLYTDVHGPQSMSPNHMIWNLLSIIKLTFLFFSDTSPHLVEISSRVPRGWILIDDPMNFPLKRHREVQICGFEYKVSTTTEWVVIKFDADLFVSTSGWIVITRLILYVFPSTNLMHRAKRINPTYRCFVFKFSDPNTVNFSKKSSQDILAHVRWLLHDRERVSRQWKLDRY